MLTESEFKTLVAQAYEHLYDLVYLRCHPLVDLLICGPTLERKEQAWKLHHLLLQALDDLDPGPGAPATSIEVRRHQLMVLRYADGLDPQTVSDRLAISRRHFYREHETTLEAIGQALWQRYLDIAPGPLATESSTPATDRGQLLRQEAERLARTDHFAYLHEVLPGVRSLLEARLCQRNLVLTILAPTTAPPVGLDRNLLRQLLLAALSFLAERCTAAGLTLAADVTETHMDVRLSVAPMPMPANPALLASAEPESELVAAVVKASSDISPLDRLRTQSADLETDLAPVRELASLGQIEVSLLDRAGTFEGVILRLPRAPQRTVLVVDDNRDALEFFHRVLPYHSFRVISAATGSEALLQARTALPNAIVLDVMMPDQDGWDVLQVLRNQPETQDIPVVICSVLRAAELALSMGANAFLPKPITEDALLAVLRGLTA